MISSRYQKHAHHGKQANDREPKISLAEFHLHKYSMNAFYDGCGKKKNSIKELFLSTYQIFLKKYCMPR